MDYLCSAVGHKPATIHAGHPAIAAERFVDFIEPQKLMRVTVTNPTDRKWHYIICWRPTIYEDN